MKIPEIELIVVAFVLFHLESTIKTIFKDAHAKNVETFIFVDIVILSTTIVTTKVLKSSFIIVGSTAIFIFRSSKIIAKSTKCDSKSHSNVTVASNITLNTSTSMIHRSATTKNLSLDSDTAICNTKRSFSIHFDAIISLKQMSVKNYRVNNSVQIFDVYCNR